MFARSQMFYCLVIGLKIVVRLFSRKWNFSSARDKKYHGLNPAALKQAATGQLGFGGRLDTWVPYSILPHPSNHTSPGIQSPRHTLAHHTTMSRTSPSSLAIVVIQYATTDASGQGSILAIIARSHPGASDSCLNDNARHPLIHTQALRTEPHPRRKAGYRECLSNTVWVSTAHHKYTCQGHIIVSFIE